MRRYLIGGVLITLLGVNAYHQAVAQKPDPQKSSNGVAAALKLDPGAVAEIEKFFDPPAAKTRTKTCQVTSTGAKHLHISPGFLKGKAPDKLPAGEFRPHVYVSCSLSGPGSNLPAIFFVRMSDGRDAFASQALSIIGAAHLSGKKLLIVYDPADTTADLIGCNPSVCKPILALRMQEELSP